MKSTGGTNVEKLCFTFLKWLLSLEAIVCFFGCFEWRPKEAEFFLFREKWKEGYLKEKERERDMPQWGGLRITQV